MEITKGKWIGQLAISGKHLSRIKLYLLAIMNTFSASINQIEVTKEKDSTKICSTKEDALQKRKKDTTKKRRCSLTRNSK